MTKAHFVISRTLHATFMVENVNRKQTGHMGGGHNNSTHVVIQTNTISLQWALHLKLTMFSFCWLCQCWFNSNDLLKLTGTGMDGLLMQRNVEALHTAASTISAESTYFWHSLRETEYRTVNFTKRVFIAALLYWISWCSTSFSYIIVSTTYRLRAGPKQMFIL